MHTSDLLPANINATVGLDLMSSVRAPVLTGYRVMRCIENTAKALNEMTSQPVTHYLVVRGRVVPTIPVMDSVYVRAEDATDDELKAFGVI